MGKEKQAKRKEIRAEQEKKLNQQKKRRKSLRKQKLCFFELLLKIHMNSAQHSLLSRNFPHIAVTKLTFGIEAMTCMILHIETENLLLLHQLMLEGHSILQYHQ